MYLLLMMLNLTMTLTFMFLNHPMSMGLILMIQTINISLMMGLFSYSFWFSYIIFIIMIGGMLILFLYMTSLASNEMYNFSKNIFMFIIIMMISMTMMWFMIDYLIMIPLMKNSNLMEMMNNLFMNTNENMKSLMLIYNTPNLNLTMMLINYLFLTLIAVVKITNLNYGPLRQKF